MYRLKGTPEERHFMIDVIHGSGQNLLECLRGRCTASCPISSPTVGGPRRLIDNGQKLPCEKTQNI